MLRRGQILFYDLASAGWGLNFSPAIVLYARRPQILVCRRVVACRELPKRGDGRKFCSLQWERWRRRLAQQHFRNLQMLVQAGCDQRPRCARPNVAFLADAMRERLSPVIAGASYVYGRAISREGGGMRRNRSKTASFRVKSANFSERGRASACWRKTKTG